MSEPRKYVLEFPAYYKPKLRDHPAYGQWAMMLTRCRNKQFPKYKDYGARGISVCPRWEKGENGLSGFQCFMQDMGNKPTPKHSLDRIDNNGNYEPSNCRWATSKRQANNRRSNHLLTYKGETMSMMDMAAKHGMSYFVLRNRISRGWSVEDAIEKPDGFYGFRPVPKGEQLSRCLSDCDVLEIRRMYANKEGTMESIGLKFGVGAPNVWQIVHRKTWRHLP